MNYADHLFKRHHFDRLIITLCVRWYVRYKLSYRDLVEIMAERGLSLVHTTIMRWVIRFIPGRRASKLLTHGYRHQVITV